MKVHDGSNYPPERPPDPPGMAVTDIPATYPVDLTPRTLSCGHTFSFRHVACPACFAEARADHDAHRRQLQARNTELVEENRRLRAELAEASRPAGAAPCKIVVTDENGFPVGRCKIVGPHSVHRAP